MEENACSVEEFLALGKTSSTAGCEDGGMRGGTRDEGVGSRGNEDVRECSRGGESLRGEVWGGGEEEDDHSEALGELNGRVGTIDGADIRDGRSTRRERGVREEEEEMRLVDEEEVVDLVKVSRRGREQPVLRTAQSVSFVEHLEERPGAVEGSLGGSDVVLERYQRVQAYVEEAGEDGH